MGLSLIDGWCRARGISDSALDFSFLTMISDFTTHQNIGFTSSPMLYSPAPSSHSTKWRRVVTTDPAGEKGATSVKLKKQTKRCHVLSFWPDGVVLDISKMDDLTIATQMDVHGDDDTQYKSILGMEFDSEQSAYEFYNSYGGRVGFSIRKEYAHKSKTGEITSRTFVCSKEGLRKYDKRDFVVRIPRAKTRTGCGALMSIKLIRQIGKYRVINFVETHNHPLVLMGREAGGRELKKDKDARAEIVQDYKGRDIQADPKLEQSSRYKSLCSLFTMISSQASELEETYEDCVQEGKTFLAFVQNKLRIRITNGPLNLNDASSTMRTNEGSENVIQAKGLKKRIDPIRRRRRIKNSLEKALETSRKKKQRAQAFGNHGLLAGYDTKPLGADLGRDTYDATIYSSTNFNALKSQIQCLGHGMESLNMPTSELYFKDLLCLTHHNARLTHITIRQGTLEFKKPISLQSLNSQEKDSRDGLAKTMYSRLFDWLVDKINVSIGQDPNSKSLIGVLDIYGFESFKTNR
ncbi:unnamed protein product [Camellia sinensis]